MKLLNSANLIKVSHGEAIAKLYLIVVGEAVNCISYTLQAIGHVIAP